MSGVVPGARDQKYACRAEARVRKSLYESTF